MGSDEAPLLSDVTPDTTLKTGPAALEAFRRWFDTRRRPDITMPRSPTPEDASPTPEDSLPTPGVVLLPDESSRHHELFTEYGCYKGGGADYIRTHYRRYVETLDLVGAVRGCVLELGASEPSAFTLMLADGHQDIEIWMARAYEVTTKARQGTAVVEPASPTAPRLEFPCSWFNVEDDTWPYEDESFDVVLCMELFEHLMLDPYHVFREANRVLRPGGIFVLTTPNIVSYTSVTRVLSGRAPYIFGVFSAHGSYGRHNREWAPAEIASLGVRAGFDTDVLDTRDLYDLDTDIEDARSLLAARGDDGALRGDGIFYRGLRARPADESYPPELYDYDPGEHRGDLRAADLAVARPGEPVRVEVTATNRSAAAWEPVGDQRTRIGFQLLAGDGDLLVQDYALALLDRPVPPGETIRIVADVPAPLAAGRYGLRVDLVREHVCWFSDRQRDGRGPAIVLPLAVERSGDPSGARAPASHPTTERGGATPEKQ